MKIASSQLRIMSYILTYVEMLNIHDWFSSSDLNELFSWVQDTGIW